MQLLSVSLHGCMAGSEIQLIDITTHKAKIKSIGANILHHGNRGKQKPGTINL